MSTELDPFFTALRHDADELPTATPDLARRRGRQRRRRTVLAASFAAFLVLASVALVAGNRPGRDQPAPPAPADRPTSTPIKFDTLVPVGPGIRFGRSESSASGSPVVVGDRAFITWETGDDNLAIVAAVELSTGRKIWGPVALASFTEGAMPLWHPRYAVVVGRNEGESRRDGAVFVLAPDTGKILLRVDIAIFGPDDVLLGESTLVVGSRSDRTTRGYDLATGQVRWTIPDPPNGIARNVAMQRSPGPSIATQRDLRGGVPFAAREFVQFADDGTAIVRELDTGRETARRPGALQVSAHIGWFVFDGVLYSLDAGRTRLNAVVLTPSGAARTVYTAEPGVTLYWPFVCGTSRICFGESAAPGDGHITAVDVVRDAMLWRHADSFDWVQTASGQVLTVNATTTGNLTSIFDPSGRQLLNERAREGDVAWIDDRAVLQSRAEQVDTSTRTLLFGVSPLDSDPVPLGEVIDVRGCDTSRTHLVCLTTNDIKVWRFAKG